MSYRIGIFGATGAVGQELLQLLVNRSFPAESIRLFASARSAGKTVSVNDKTWAIEEAQAGAFAELDLALFSVSGGFSQEMGPKAVEAGCVVVDNSSAFRMDPEVPLVVPEVNLDALDQHKGIIANPNCSTAITLMGLYPLHELFGVKRFFASTYQAVSGSGVAGMQELEKQTRAWAAGETSPAETYPHQIAFNVLPHVDVFYPDGYTKEEHKMTNESRKIMGTPDLRVSTTCVRVPVMRAHSVAISAEFDKPVDVAAARAAIETFPGVQLIDNPDENGYPLPLNQAGQNDCAVGRLREDLAFDNGLSFWVVGDQILKGAALNAVQIAEALHEKGLVHIQS